MVMTWLAVSCERVWKDGRAFDGGSGQREGEAGVVG